MRTDDESAHKWHQFWSDTTRISNQRVSRCMQSSITLRYLTAEARWFRDQLLTARLRRHSRLRMGTVVAIATHCGTSLRCTSAFKAPQCQSMLFGAQQVTTCWAHHARRCFGFCVHRATTFATTSSTAWPAVPSFRKLSGRAA